MERIIRLVSFGVVTDGVTLFYLKSDDLFVYVLYRHHSQPLCHK